MPDLDVTGILFFWQSHIGKSKCLLQVDGPNKLETFTFCAGQRPLEAFLLHGSTSSGSIAEAFKKRNMPCPLAQLNHQLSSIQHPQTEIGFQDIRIIRT